MGINDNNNKSPIIRPEDNILDNGSSSMLDRGIALSGELSKPAHTFSNIKEIYRLTGIDFPQFSPKGNFLAGINIEDFTIDIFDILSGTLIGRLAGFKKSVFRDIRGYKVIFDISSSEKYVAGALVSPGVSDAPTHEDILLWDLSELSKIKKTFHPISRFKVPHPTIALKINRDEQIITSIHPDNILHNINYHNQVIDKYRLEYPGSRDIRISDGDEDFDFYSFSKSGEDIATCVQSLYWEDTGLEPTKFFTEGRDISTWNISGLPKKYSIPCKRIKTKLPYLSPEIFKQTPSSVGNSSYHAKIALSPDAKFAIFNSEIGGPHFTQNLREKIITFVLVNIRSGYISCKIHLLPPNWAGNEVSTKDDIYFRYSFGDVGTHKLLSMGNTPNTQEWSYTRNRISSLILTKDGMNCVAGTNWGDIILMDFQNGLTVSILHASHYSDLPFPSQGYGGISLSTDKRLIAGSGYSLSADSDNQVVIVWSY